MKAILTIFIALTSVVTFGQKLKFKIVGQADTTVHLVKYSGTKLFYADTAEIKGGYVEFDGAKQQPGMLGILLPGQQLFEFIYNKEEVHIETQKPNFVETMKVKKSEENRIFNDYVKFISERKTTAQKLATEINTLEKTDPKYKGLEDQINAINKEVIAYQHNLVKTYPNMLVGKMIKMTLEVEIPEPPVDAKGNIIDSNFRYHYYRDHYFDNTDFSVDGLVNTSVFGNKIEYFFGNKMLVQHWDTILKYAYRVIDQMDPKSKAFEYVVSYVTSSFGKSKQMGMDKVYVMMADKYYCTRNAEGKSPASWMTEDKLEELCEKITVQKNLVMGVKAPNIILPDTLDRPWDKLNWINLHKINAEYTILYFWDPECGHCKKITPKLAELYDKKFKGRNIEVLAIGKASGDDYKKWKDYIVKNKLNFLNVAVTETILKIGKEDARMLIPRFTTLESMNIHLTYDIFSTPRLFVLDKDKKFIAKQISISQLEDMMDRLQNKTDLPKLFPPDKEEDEQMTK
ncbi:MAG: redoxin domain-containing protein [Crocinitomicaceae bacterium]|nr:redoxin domain-containing protein [Crocinitomicaceae bacterium]